MLKVYFVKFIKLCQRLLFLLLEDNYVTLQIKIKTQIQLYDGVIMIKNLQSLRGLAALMIFAHHFGFSSVLTDSFGDCAVAIFMMLSGFVLTLSFSRSVDADCRQIPSINRFMLKRMIRIYPLYFLGQISIFTLCRFEIEPIKAIADLLMLQSWIPLKSYYFSGNSPSWFVCDLMFCYLLFIPVFKLFNEKIKKSMAFLSIMLIVYFSAVLFLPDNLVHPIIYIFPPMQFPVFVIGMLGAILFKKSKTFLSTNVTEIFLFGSLCLLLCQMFAYPFVTTRLSFGAYWWISAFALIYLLSVCDKVNCLISKIFHARCLVKLGDISYAFYIFHLPFLYFWRVLLQKLGVTLQIGVDFIISAAILCCLSLIIHRLIEVPLIRVLDRRMS